MGMKTVYRVEHMVSGAGPYVDGGLQTETNYDLHTSTRGRPSPWVDGIKTEEFTEQHICGFTTKRALRRWFYRFRHWLKQKGYGIAIYMVDSENIVVVNHQCVFIPSNEKSVYTIEEMLA